MGRPPDLEKRELVADALWREPDASDRSIARRLGLSRHLVQTVRSRMFPKEASVPVNFEGARPHPRDLSPGPVPDLPLVARVGDPPTRPKPKHPAFVLCYSPSVHQVYDLDGEPFIAPRVWRRNLVDGSCGVTCRFDAAENRIRYNLESFVRNQAQRGIEILGWDLGYLKPIGGDSYVAPWETTDGAGAVVRTASAEVAFVEFVRDLVAAGSLPRPTEAHLVLLRDRLKAAIGVCTPAHPASDRQLAELAFVEGEIMRAVRGEG